MHSNVFAFEPALIMTSTRITIACIAGVFSILFSFQCFLFSAFRARRALDMFSRAHSQLLARVGTQNALNADLRINRDRRDRDGGRRNKRRSHSRRCCTECNDHCHSKRAKRDGLFHGVTLSVFGCFCHLGFRLARLLSRFFDGKTRNRVGKFFDYFGSCAELVSVGAS